MDQHDPARILIIDDDRDMAAMLRHLLSRDGYEVELAHSGSEGLRQAYVFQPDLVLLDILMPAMDGWELLRRIRELSDVPVIVLTAVGGEDARVKGLDLGADDYVDKPFGMQELQARIQAVLRRASLPPSTGQHVLSFDDDQMIIDPFAQSVMMHGSRVELTPTEYKLLLYLAYNSGRVLSQAQILEAVWGSGYAESHNSVKVYIRRLRSKIEDDPKHPRYVRTRRGSGYFLADTPPQ